MRKHLGFGLSLLVTALALVASSLLLVDYLRPVPVFCDPDGGCATVRHTVFAYPLGIPLPALGIAGLVTLGVLAMVPGRRAARLALGLAAVGAIAALGLVAVQIAIGAFCKFCLVVDGSSVLLAGLALARVRSGSEPPTGRLVSLGASGTLVSAVVVPFAIGSAREPEEPPGNVGVPPVIAAELARGPKGVLTIVDFVDYECPFCRMTNHVLEPMLAARKGKVRLVRKHVPLAMHPHALDAARAGICAEELGQGDAMTSALFTAPPETLTPEGCEKLAIATGLDAARFHACVVSPDTEARIKSDRELWKAAHGRALPTLWIGSTEVIGAKDPSELEAILDREGGSG